MAKTITEAGVFAAATQIAIDGRIPTIASIGQKLRAGSETTIELQDLDLANTKLKNDYIISQRATVSDSGL